MARSRVARVTGLTLVPPKSRVLKVSGTGSVVVTPKSRVLKVTGSGAVAVVVNPLPNLTDLEPESLVTVTASLASGVTADSWAWRVVSGPAATIFGVGAAVQITAPSNINGAVVTIGTRATLDSVQSPEVTFTLTVLPQAEWWWSDTAWTPAVDLWEADIDSLFGGGVFGEGVFGS